MTLPSRGAQGHVVPCPACSMSLCSVHRTARCGLALAPPNLQQKECNGCFASECSHMFPSLPLRKAHVARGPASGVKHSRSAFSNARSAVFLSGNLCMAIRVVPVQHSPALSMMACCSGGNCWCNFAACTASAAEWILDSSFAKAMSRATLLGKTWPVVCTSAARMTSAASLSAAHELVSLTFSRAQTAPWACSSTATPAVGKSAFVSGAEVSSGCCLWSMSTHSSASRALESTFSVARHDKGRERAFGTIWNARTSSCPLIPTLLSFHKPARAQNTTIVYLARTTTRSL